ncbi:hypothetical protein FGG08_000534 [Glutinoglossum americanum]|uniref:ABC transporter domain-containing protein n=1 Tax=Glutinoglossum americanum TaxID=1670608 RepID=A0A9P8II21_9PEZI|nr:hypothetical protein FGG08_000534 [Glutinoglossum americanum]
MPRKTSSVLPRQTWALTLKTLLIALIRHLPSTFLRAFILPIAYMVFLANARRFLVPPAYYGIGTSAPIKDLSVAMDAASGGRNTVAFVNGGYEGGDIEKVINQSVALVEGKGKIVKVLRNETELVDVCRNSLRLVSSCFAAAVFHSSPTEGPGGIWNYTLRTDAALGSRVDVRKSTNDVEVYIIPLQNTIDTIIASLNTTIDRSSLPSKVYEYPYTSRTNQEREDNIRTIFMNGIIDYTAVAFFVGVVGVIYQLVGFMATERETGMAQLIDAMATNIHTWQPQLARLVSHHLAFDIIYLPGWVIMSLVLTNGLFTKTSPGVLIVFHILAGLSLTSFSIFGAAFFKKAQLSGISTTIIAILLAIVAQVVSHGGAHTGTITVLGLLFPPMTYVFFFIYIARWQKQNIPTDLVHRPPSGVWGTIGIVLWVFLIVQIFAYLLLGALVERHLHGTSSKARTVVSNTADDDTPTVQMTEFSKHYKPGWFFRYVAPLFGRRKDTVIAVDGLTLAMDKGHITVLLGANGSGKTTTLECIAGLLRLTNGSIRVDGTGGLGICPQKNVLWDHLTVGEHVGIFNKLKTSSHIDSKAQISDLIKDCDLDRKLNAKAKTLSGGQKRKLQLCMMFAGGSQVCCIDEVSSGLDSLSRRKIWDILLAERGKRTIIMTTHFLDEAEILADHIAILSKGTLRVEGSAVELKHRLGGGYKVHVDATISRPSSPIIAEFPILTAPAAPDHTTTYAVADSSQAAQLVGQLEEMGITEYNVVGPTIEDVFMSVAEEVKPADKSVPPERKEGEGSESTPVSTNTTTLPGGEKGPTPTPPPNEPANGVTLYTGHRISLPAQAFVLFRKRLTVLRRNFMPLLAAFLIPIIAAILVRTFIRKFGDRGCSNAEQTSSLSAHGDVFEGDFDMVVGPASRLGLDSLMKFGGLYQGAITGDRNVSRLVQSIHFVDTLAEFDDYIRNHFHNVTPGGFFLGGPAKDSPATFAYHANFDLYSTIVTHNALSILSSNISIGTQYQPFDIPYAPGTGFTLQFVTYFGLAMVAFPGFFALYPTGERLRNVRSLQYSNGVRALPLWTAYVTFDFLVVLASSVIIIGLFAGASTGVWYHLPYLFVVILLYGLASILLAYVISLFAKSQLAAFAFCSGGQAVLFLAYFIAYLCVLSFTPTERVDSVLKIAHYTIAIIAPPGNLIRAVFIAINMFAVSCQGKRLAPYPGAITLYGGPILYLLLQSFALFGFLLWWDSGPMFNRFRKSYRIEDAEEIEPPESSVTEELQRVSSSNDGLRVLHATKAYGSLIAIQDVTFGVTRGDIFALVGPNAAGKSTTISLIRGDIQPSDNKSEILVENISVRKHRASARSRLGVCPQIDARDEMTTIEHLRFYARIRGVNDVEHNVSEVLRAVGLEEYGNRMAAKLSGGNKRKLSLGVALMGNPAVLLLDEPSSGMDAVAKRTMWKTLLSVSPGRSLVLTTHSMEEANALASHVGILARKMLALGTPTHLRHKYGNAYHVHLITCKAAQTTPEEMDRIRAWIVEKFPNATVEDRSYHGQMKFSIPANQRKVEPAAAPHGSGHDEITPCADGRGVGDTSGTCSGGIGAVFRLLEAHKDELRLAYYSVSPTTLDEVFLAIVSRHNVQEENYQQKQKKKKRFLLF